MFTENYWDGQLSELVDRRDKINAKRRDLAKDQSLTREQRDHAINEFTAKLYTKEEQEIPEIGVSNAAYHYLGSAKVLTQIGQAFAGALTEMSRTKKPPANRGLCGDFFPSARGGHRGDGG